MKICLISLLIVGAAAGCRTREQTANPTHTAAAPAPAAEASVTVATPNPQPADGAPAMALHAGLFSCEASAQLGNWVERARDLADADGNGKVSREEARGAMNFALGGLFFRADSSADGKVTSDEAAKLKKELTERQPAIEALLARAKTTTGETPYSLLSRVLDVEPGKAISIDDARKASQGSLDQLFRTLDGNQDGQIAREEAVAASVQGLQAAGRGVFASADANKDGYLSSGEFTGKIESSAQSVFQLVDANRDGKLSEAEAASVMSSVARTLEVPRSDSTG